MKNILVVANLFVAIFAYTQDFSITLTVKNLPQKETYLATFYGEKNSIIDTVMPSQEGKIVFEMKPDHYKGMYRIFLDKSVFFDLVCNQEDIEIKTNYENIYEELEIIQSKENMIYYDFLRKGNDYRRKFDLLAPLNDYYPRTDSFFLQARMKYIMIQAEFLMFTDSLINSYPDLWATRIIRQKKPLFYDPSLDETGRKEYITEHYFDNIDFADPDLIRSNFYTSVAIEYMSLFSNPNLTQEELENEFIRAVDKIMAEAMENSIVYEFIVDYLVGGFERFHFDKVLDYIAQNYSPDQCENEERKTDLQTRLKKYAELSVGKPGPEIITTDLAGNQVKLSEIKAEYTLVLFWASWCPHCAESLPEIMKIYNSTDRTKLEIIAVSLDKEKPEWETAVKTLQFGWINCCDLKGWDSQAAVDYNVYATPTIFLLDKRKLIVAKPITLNELNADLKKQLIIE
jgi:thiol-disulfide isomerase/thioredoxin